jgi:hypothetical protein
MKREVIASSIIFLIIVRNSKRRNWYTASLEGTILSAQYSFIRTLPNSKNSQSFHFLSCYQATMTSFEGHENIHRTADFGPWISVSQWSDASRRA